MNTAVHFSSKTDEWETPDGFFKAMDEEWNFTLDVCATPKNAKCYRYFTKEMDGLASSWEGEVCWCNPPYSQLKLWLAKAASEAKRGAKVAMLIPARTDTKAFHQYVWDAEKHATRPGVRLCLLPGRLKFGGAKTSAPFPSMIVSFTNPNA